VEGVAACLPLSWRSVSAERPTRLLVAAGAYLGEDAVELEKMLETVAVWFVRAIALYAAVGLAFAVAFVVRGIGSVDSRAQGASIGFRLMILPASAALWPLLARRWRATTGAPPIERNAHRSTAVERTGSSPG
jgi:hypothetical protein